MAMSFAISWFSLYDLDVLYFLLVARKMADSNGREFVKVVYFYVKFTSVPTRKIGPKEDS